MNVLLGIFSIILLLFGSALISLSISAQQSLGDACASKSVNTGLNVLLCLGVLIVTFVLVGIACNIICKCKGSDLPYLYITIFLSVTSIITASVVLSGLKDLCNSDRAKSYMIMLIIANSILFVIALGIRMAPRLYKKFRKGIEKGENDEKGEKKYLQKIKEEKYLCNYDTDTKTSNCDKYSSTSKCKKDETKWHADNNLGCTENKDACEKRCKISLQKELGDKIRKEREIRREEENEDFGTEILFKEKQHKKKRKKGKKIK